MVGFNGIRIDIQKLMCSILFIRKLSDSPYAEFVASHLLMDIQSIFARDFCSLLGLSPSAPLLVATQVGTTALPTIFKMSSIIKSGMNMVNTQNLFIRIGNLAGNYLLKYLF